MATQADLAPRLQKDLYFPEIDGLRTIAVVSVFAFHLDNQIVAGGFVGVDIFFVISGFLITNVIYGDMLRGQFSLVRFYQRRIARIAPAALTVIAITMIIGYFIYSAQDFASLGASALAAAASTINIKLLFQGSYFKISQDAQPLIHYWSLALEEQFYLLFPILLLLISRATRHVLPVLLVCLTMSFAACVATTPLAPMAAFYLLPTRAWELLAGSSLAVAKKQSLCVGERPAGLITLIGVALILLSFLVVRADDFPGWIAALPVAGATLALAGIGSAKGRIDRLLSNTAMVYVGKRSYSLYLWHWPIFSFVDYALYMTSPVIVLGLKFIITTTMTLLTCKFVERPMRIWLNTQRHRVIAFTAFVLGVTVLGLSGYMIRTNYYLTAEPDNVAAGGILVNPEGKKWVVVIGDSQGAMYGYELASIARAQGFRLNILSAAAGNELPQEPNTLWPSVSQFLGQRRPDLIILAQAWTDKLGEIGEGNFINAIVALSDRTDNVIVITQPPEPPSDATRHEILMGARPPFFEEESSLKRRAQANAIIQKCEGDHVRVLDVEDLFVMSDNSIRLIAPSGRLAFQDSGHLSSAGTAIVRPRLERVLTEVLNLPQKSQ